MALLTDLMKIHIIFKTSSWGLPYLRYQSTNYLVYCLRRILQQVQMAFHSSEVLESFTLPGPYACLLSIQK